MVEKRDEAGGLLKDQGDVSQELERGHIRRENYAPGTSQTTFWSKDV